jgi:cell division protein FtsB
LLRELKRRLLAALPPVIFLAITGYFAWNAVHGSRGLEAQARERAQLAMAQQDFAQVDALRAQWQTRIADLGGPAIAPDMLDAQARAVLNLAEPADLVVALPASGAAAGK